MMLARWSKLYTHQTVAEQALEPAIASLGVRYRTQHPLWALQAFADFALPDHKLVIEVDDDSHRRAAKKRADAERTARMNGAGWTVARCWNDEAIADPFGTVDRLLAAVGLDLRTKRAP